MNNLKIIRQFKWVKIDQKIISDVYNIAPDCFKNYFNPHNEFKVRVMPNLYQCLLHTIISQQMSSVLIENIWVKINSSVKKINPKNIYNLNKDVMESFGLTKSKIDAIKAITLDIINNKINLKQLSLKDNSEIVKTLTTYKGIGEWTANIWILFGCMKNNCIPFDDLGIKNAIKLTGLDKYSNEKIFKMFSGYNSVLSFILWRIHEEHKKKKDK